MIARVLDRGTTRFWMKSTPYFCANVGCHHAGDGVAGGGPPEMRRASVSSEIYTSRNFGKIQELPMGDLRKPAANGYKMRRPDIQFRSRNVTFRRGAGSHLMQKDQNGRSIIHYPTKKQ